MLRAAVVSALLLLPVGPSAHLSAQSADEWVRQCRTWGGSGVNHCETREYTLAAGSGALRIDATPNGGITVKAWDRRDVKVEARVQARAGSESAAKELAGEIVVNASGRSVTATGPRSMDRRSWSVSYVVWAPAASDLDLESTNGGIGVEGIAGDVRAETTNGGIDLEGALGRVDAETTNGGITIALTGSRSGGAISAETTNGGITLTLPEGSAAELDAETTNGGISVNFPVTVQGRIGRRLRTSIGEGGPAVRLETTNGGITIRR
jgi:DUF4097 and DUF4098 domain-containing protein YvlB